MLNHGPSKRYNLNQIKNHLWFKKKFKDSGTPMINSIFPVFLHLLYFWFWFCICTPLSFIRVSKFLLLVWFCNPIILWFNEKKEDLKSLSMSGTIVTLVNHLNSGSDWYLVWRDLKSKSRNQWIKWIFRLVLFRCVWPFLWWSSCMTLFLRTLFIKLDYQSKEQRFILHLPHMILNTCTCFFSFAPVPFFGGLAVWQCLTPSLVVFQH